jgi:multicomponent Na+:H+ antiporter subunit C
VRLIIGLVLLGHAANLLVFTVSGLINTRAPYVDQAGKVPPDAADPLPQALILTAIVIGLGTQAFAIVLIHRTYQTVATDDLRRLTSTDVMHK